MNSAASESLLTAPERNADESRSLMVLFPPQTKIKIMSYIRTQQSLSRLSQTCRDWYETATRELYTRDAKRHRSFAIKWMAAHAVDDQTTASAIRTLKISRRWGGQIDAVQQLQHLSQSNIERLNKDQIMYKTSTALHFAVVLGNMRLVETLLDVKASPTIPCRRLDLLLESMGSEEVLRRDSYFQSVFRKVRFIAVFPIYLAFLKNDPHMCKLLVKHGAGREAKIIPHHIFCFSDFRAMSILHFAAADPTKDYRQWQCLFDGFGEYIDEFCGPSYFNGTPLHVALKSGCTQGMHLAVESGADKEAENVHSSTPLYEGIPEIPYCTTDYQKTFEKPITCLRKFVELGASVNPEGDSVLMIAVGIYASNPVNQPNMRELIYFLLDHHADVHGTNRRNSSNVVNEIALYCHSSRYEDPLARELVKELLSDLVNRGLNLTIPAPGLPSPLYRVLNASKAKRNWLFDFLCEKGATIHEDEVDTAFLRWCEISRLWEMIGYTWWRKHQGQEDKFLLKWCENPYNGWWWQHVKQIPSIDVTLAYEVAFKHKDRQLYYILTHLPLAAPLDGLLVRVAFEAKPLWSWRLVVHRKFEEKSLASLSFDKGENMIHLTVRKYVAERCYSTMEAVLAVLHLRDKGVNMSSPNSLGQTPLELLLKMGSCNHDVLELVSLLEGKTKVFNMTIPELRKRM
ncbi:uncharacterized protein CPUR_05646 [Claviceps purpurea 20.1]|uniref:F-box domain-containing protein n=1 Tax=Claviceps purpurea (strain 20.1) TaxID=1111077 RepID=M1W2D9_CLAP2|nr:uncharacterized protein CPUR_05646 [Claviceps purpurea 20.1]